MEVPQPDGTTVEAVLHGDEFHHYFTTPAGEPLVRDAAGFLRAAGVEAEVFRAEMAEKSLKSPRRQQMTKALAAQRRAPGVAHAPAAGGGYGLAPGSTFPLTGSPRVLVLLVEYADVSFTLDKPSDYFTRMLTEEGFSDYKGTGSALDFFRENSCGLFEPQFDVLGPVKLPNDRAYYGANGSNGDDARAHMMVVDGCRALDNQIDFSVYDNDKDGIVDNVFVFFAGEAESSTGVADQVWPHTFFLSYASQVPLVLDGVMFNRYACSNEWNGRRGLSAARPDGVGTFVHEFSHVLGLPDLYSVTYNSAFTPGTWSTLDYGPYNNNGCTPPYYSIFERYALGWMQPRELTDAANVRLEAISQNMGAMIPTLKETEFFLFENRQQQGWDKYIPGHGMLVWHIDYDANVWMQNTVNTTVSHQYVDIEEADGMGTEETRADDAFPGGLNRTTFTDTTIPSMMPWTGRSVNMPITDIAESADGIITFKARGGRPEVEIPTPLAATDIEPGSFKAHWTAVDVPGSSYALSVYTRTGPGARGIVYLPDYKYLNVGTATEYVVSGLKPDTQYYYFVCTVVDNESSDPSDEMAVQTAPPTFDYLAPVALEATDVTGESFTAHWEALAGAVDYKITVRTLMPSGTLVDVCDFTGGLTALAEGWTTTSNSTYSIPSNAGASVPSLRFTRADQELCTPAYSDGISSLEFWTRGISTAQGDALIVDGADEAGTWRTLATIAVVTTVGGETHRINDIPADIVKFRFTSAQSKGSISLDDVKIMHGTAYSPTPLQAYNERSVGAQTSVAVTSLQPKTEYTYTVTASDGTLTSLPSESITVLTADASGIGMTVVDEVKVSLDGRAVTVHGAAEGTRIQLYNIAGSLLASATVKDGVATLTVPSAGAHLLKIDNHNVVKIITK